MTTRREYEMTEAQMHAILDAGKPVPAMYLSGGRSMFDSPQENANRAWKKLGDELGFDYLTVAPVIGKGQRFITAVPNKFACPRCGELLASFDEAEGCRDEACPRTDKYAEQMLRD